MAFDARRIIPEYATGCSRTRIERAIPRNRHIRIVTSILAMASWPRGHGHAHTHPTLKPSVLGGPMVATLGLVVAEIVGGFLGIPWRCLMMLCHNLSDVPALGISWLAMRWAERPADTEKTYGYPPARAPWRFHQCAGVGVSLAVARIRSAGTFARPGPRGRELEIWTSWRRFVLTVELRWRCAGAERSEFAKYSNS